MSQFLTNKYLKYRNARAGGVIEDDQRCVHCSYNLRGLKLGGTCPECGTPIPVITPPDAALHDMPLPLIRRLRLDCWLATIAIVGFLGHVVFGMFSSGNSELRGVLTLGFGIAWIVAAWRLTVPVDLPAAAQHGFAPTSKLRRGARLLQLGWVAVITGIGVDSLGSGSWLTTALQSVGLLVGLVGLVVLLLHLARLADWVMDEFARKAFHMAIWGNCVAAMLLLVLVPLLVVAGGVIMLRIILLLFILPPALLLLVSVLAFPAGLFSLSRSVDWSVVHSLDQAYRARRSRAKMKPGSRTARSIPDQIKIAESSEDATPIRHSSSQNPTAEDDAS